jgi:ferric-dicitrate binding protein FerR (iron transport regulator)
MSSSIQNIFSNYFSGKLHLKDQISLSEKIAGAQSKEVDDFIRNDWETQLESEDTTVYHLDHVLDKVHHHIRLSEGKSTIVLNAWNYFQRIAAILIFPLLLSFAAYYYFSQETSVVNAPAYAEIQCPMGVRTKFDLPDGSTGFLNSGSRLKYPVQFNGERKVELVGEAFFDVVHNAESPFHVTTKNLDIKVLGTSFNVIANEDEPTEEIVLQTGSVDVSSLSGKSLAVLSPNEQLILDVQKRTFEKNKVEASTYTSWKEGKLVFRKENMQQMARRLSRWYNVDIVVDDKELDDYTFHATFIDEPLDEVLKMLSITTPLKYVEENRTTDNQGAFKKRKVYIRLNKTKIDQFK